MAPKSLVALSYGLSFSSLAGPGPNSDGWAARVWPAFRRGLETLPYRVPAFERQRADPKATSGK